MSTLLQPCWSRRRFCAARAVVVALAIRGALVESSAEETLVLLPSELAAELSIPESAVLTVEATPADPAAVSVGFAVALVFVQALSGQGKPIKALVGGTLIDGFGGRPIRNSVVLIDGERISAVGQLGTLAVPSGAEVISTEGMSVADVAKRLRGEKGTTVHITIGRQGREKPLEFTVVRDEIPRPSVPIAFFLKPSVGYVRLETFNETTSKELAEKLKELGLIDQLIREPLGGAHRAPHEVAVRLKETVTAQLEKLDTLETETLLEQRYRRLMDYGAFERE